MIAMLLVTVGSQLEMVALGVIAKAGPDMFVLFGNEKGGKLEKVTQLDLQSVQDKWQTITENADGILTSSQASQYISEHSSMSLLHQISAFLTEQLDFSSHLIYLAAILVFVALFKAISLFIHRYFIQVVSIRVSRDLRLRYFAHIQSLPMSFYHKHDIGSLSSRVVGDAGVVATAINSMLINYIQTPFAIVTTLTACVLLSWKLSIIIFIGFPLVVVPIVYISKKIKIIAKQMQRNQEGFASVLIDFLAGIMTVKVFAMEDFSYQKYRQQNDHMAKLAERSARYGLASRPILHTVSSLFFAAVIIVGLYVFQMGPSELLVFCGLLYIFYEPVKKFAEENNQILRGVAAAERMYEVLDETSPILDDPDAVDFEQFKEKIEFKDVSFRYGDEWILKDLSFTVNKGEMVALVGPTGAGKSTIAQLLPRLYDVQKGEIYFDNRPMKSYTQKSLREKISFVSQKPFLFLDSVQQNISFGRSFSDKQVTDAARRAHAEEFIKDLPGQYQFQLAESGKNLSGGQQQRLAIARALVKDAPILVMDEATSALDSVSENKIKEAIADLQGSVTQIIIAHRLSTIAHADKIIYLEKGRKVAEGTKDQLLEICPNFRRMWDMMMHTENS